ncbi:MAG: hypothetical protein AAB393_14200 [Bacteroidota bacterium]
MGVAFPLIWVIFQADRFTSDLVSSFMIHNYRQEVLNVVLAQLLQERGIISAPEDVLKTSPKDTRKMPDVMVNFFGLRTAIEGEVDDQDDAAPKALASARKRVDQGIVHIAVAVVYPSSLRKHPFNRLKDELAKAELRIAVVTESGDKGYDQGNVDRLGEFLRRAFGELIQEDVVAQAVDELKQGIEKFVAVTERDAGTIARLAEVLGIQELPIRGKKSKEDDE